MFKDILYPTLCSLQNQTFDGRIMYLTGIRFFIAEMNGDIETSLTEIQNCFQLLLPHPDDFFIKSSTDNISTDLKTTQNSISIDDDNRTGQLPTSKSISNNINTCHTHHMSLIDNIVNDKSNRNLHSEHLSTGNVINLSNNSGTSVSFNEIQGCSILEQTETDTESSSIDLTQIVNFNSGNREGSVSTGNRDNNEAKTDDDDDIDDDSSFVSDEEFVHQHGLGTRNYNLSIEVTPGQVSLQENPDNQVILNTLKDQYRLITIKYQPTVAQWLQVCFLCMNILIHASCKCCHKNNSD